MMNKTAAVLLLTEEVPELQNADVKYVTEQLCALNYNVEKIKAILNEETVLRQEIEACIKQCDIVIFIGGIGASYSDNICQAVSKVLHQKLVFNDRLNSKNDSKGTLVPMHAKVLEYSTFNVTNNVHKVCPVVYVQSLLLVTNDFSLLKPSFTYIIAPFLKNFNKKPLLRRVLILRNVQNNFMQLARKDNVDICYKGAENGAKVTLTSTSMASLLDCEQSFKETYGDDVKSMEDGDIPKLVYTQICYPHIKNSIECIEECFTRYGPDNVFLSFNGGKDCTVLLHLTLGVLKKRYPNYTNKLLCLYVENSNAFPELNDFVSECRQYYDLNMIKLTKGIKESLAFVLESKPNMKACLMGTRRTDPYCEHLHSFQMTDPNWPQVMRVSPLLEWHYSEIWDYLLHLGVPYCSLYDKGYTSLGSVTNTIKNPSLLINDDLKTEVYLPAYKLLDASKERNGRIQT